MTKPQFPIRVSIVTVNDGKSFFCRKYKTTPSFLTRIRNFNPSDELNKITNIYFIINKTKRGNCLYYLQPNGSRLLVGIFYDWWTNMAGFNHHFEATLFVTNSNNKK